MSQTREVLELSDDQMCFGCGSRNPRGLKLQFQVDVQRRSVQTQWTPTKEFQGYADIVHGGMTALVLDEVMGNLLWKLGSPSVTAEMAVHFRRPARVGQQLTFKARFVKTQGRLAWVSAQAHNPDGELVAEASAKYVQITSNQSGGV